MALPLVKIPAKQIVVLTKFLQKVKKLRKRNLIECKSMKVSNTVVYFDRLHTLRAECCNSLSGQGLINVAASCVNLRVLSLSKCKQLFDHDLIEPMKVMTKLEELDLSFTNVSGKCFNSLPSFEGNLKKLKMNCCAKLIDESLFVILSRCKHLKYLDISATYVTGIPLKSLVLTKLTQLHLDFCPKLSAEVAMALPRTTPNLRKLSAYGIWLSGLDINLHQELTRNIQSLKVKHKSYIRPSKDYSQQVLFMITGCNFHTSWN